MRAFFEGIYNLPVAVKILLCFCTGPFGIILIVMSYVFKKGFEISDRTDAVMENPTEKTVTELMNYLNSTMLGYNNTPETWQSLRGLWNIVNRSDKVTTPTKEKFMATLLKKGLYLNNTKINDNYKEEINE